ncbi:MAG: DUF1778 domain-containing protein [Jatrophihabitans sp.]
MDLRTTTEERELIDRAVIASGTDLTDFVVTTHPMPLAEYSPTETSSSLIPLRSNSGKSSTRDRPATCRGCAD